MATKRKTTSSKPSAAAKKAAAKKAPAKNKVVVKKAADEPATVETAEGVDEQPVAVVGMSTIPLNSNDEKHKAQLKKLSGGDADKVLATELWDRIKDQQIDIFALPNQTISDHVTRHEELEKASPESLHLTLRSDAVLPALEDTLSKLRLKANEQIDISKLSRYTVVKIVTRTF